MRAFIVVGLGYGDEGKGSTVDWLTREFDSQLTVRFNGGAQAAHHVVTPEGKEHTFHTFGSGTLAGAYTYLTPDVLVNPLAIATEAAELVDLGVEEPLKRLWIHMNCPITTPYHVALNRLKEMSRGDAKHGSCGLGIGETMEDVVHRPNEVMHWYDIVRSRYAHLWLNEIRQAKLKEAHKLIYRSSMAWEQEFHVLEGREDKAIHETFNIIAKHVNTTDQMPGRDTIVFEGAQGILIDEKWGQAPYHTWSNCTPYNAHRELSRNPQFGRVETTILGVTRAYMTRHGAGPFPTEMPHWNRVAVDETNANNPWQGKLRYGWPDSAALAYAANACRDNGGLDGLIVTCIDKLLANPVHVASGLPGITPKELFEWPREWYVVDRDGVPEGLARSAGVPLYATSHGPTATDKKFAQ